MYTYIYMYYITYIYIQKQLKDLQKISKNPFNLHQPPAFTYRARFVLQRPQVANWGCGYPAKSRTDDMLVFLWRKKTIPGKKKSDVQDSYIGEFFLLHVFNSLNLDFLI